MLGSDIANKYIHLFNVLCFLPWPYSSYKKDVSGIDT